MAFVATAKNSRETGNNRIFSQKVQDPRNSIIFSNHQVSVFQKKKIFEGFLIHGELKTLTLQSETKSNPKKFKYPVSQKSNPSDSSPVLTCSPVTGFARVNSHVTASISFRNKYVMTMQTTQTTLLCFLPVIYLQNKYLK